MAIFMMLVQMATMAEGQDVPGGFTLGSTLEAASAHAQSMGWKLVPISSDLPGEWQVRGAEEQQISLFVCKETVARVSERDVGNLDDFAEKVMAFTTKFGGLKPDIQVVTFKSGKTTLTNLDARFAGKSGVGALVQLSRTAQTEQVLTAFFSLDSGC